MTDPLDILFENLLEHLDENLPGTCWRSTSGRSRLENALLASLTPEQIELLESYQAAAWRCTEQEERFLFRSGFRLAWSCHSFPAGFFAFDATVFFGRGLSGGCGLGRRFGGRLLLGRRLLLRQSWRLPVSWRRSFRGGLGGVRLLRCGCPLGGLLLRCLLRRGRAPRPRRCPRPSSWDSPASPPAGSCCIPD